MSGGMRGMVMLKKAGSFGLSAFLFIFAPNNPCEV